MDILDTGQASTVNSLTIESDSTEKTVQSQIRARGYKTFFMLNSTEHEFFLLINVKMPTVVGILTLRSRKIAF